MPDSLDSNELHSILRCPICYESLTLKSNQCSACNTTFTSLGGIPWVFREGDQLLFEWKERLKALLQSIEDKVQTLVKEAQIPKIRPLTKQRLEILRDANIHQAKLMRRILEPLALMQTGSYDLSQGLKVKLPISQSLAGYYPNIHRDWVWGQKENQKSLECLLPHLPKDGGDLTFAFLGVGACRLPFDIHSALKPKRSYAIDINPLLLLAAKSIVQKSEIQLYEFPIAPKDLASHAVLQTLVAPHALDESFQFLFADAMNPPFMSGSLDVLVTPWFIDVVPQDLALLLPRLNRCLKNGGRWVNFGTLAFSANAISKRYSYEEVLEIVAASGFSISEVTRAKIPYLASPFSSHARVEEVFSFAAEKVVEVDQPKEFKYLPEWLTNPTMPVPLLPSLSAQVVSLKVFAEVSSLVDGKRSLQQIAKEFAKAYRMSPEEGMPSVRAFFTRIYEEQLTRSEY